LHQELINPPGVDVKIIESGFKDQAGFSTLNR